MSLIDARGRVLGLLNLVDLAIAIAVVAVLGVGAAAYRVFDIPAPVLERVEPAQLPIASAPKLTLVGSHLRHYLRAFVPRSGEPFAVTPIAPDGPAARFLSVTEHRIELQLPPLAVGTYDLHLFDDTKQVAFVPHAFSIVPPQWPRGRMEVTVLGYLPIGGTGIVRVGDRDLLPVKDPAMADLGDAEVIATRVTPDTTNDEEMSFGEYQKGDDYAWFSRLGHRAVVAIVLRVPVVQVQPPAWQYKKVPMRVGETLDFESARYHVTGPIVAIGEVEPWR